MVTKPLEGLRVIDLTRFVAGPLMTATLGALGAEVIKLEVPPGDPYRKQGTGWLGAYSMLFMSLNSGKRSVAIDFRSGECRDIVERLLASADFLVENSRPGSLTRHGLDYEAVHSRHPHLVYGSISGYGDVGPDADKGGFDLILQAESGLMSVTGSPESGPVKAGAPLLDVGAGMSCAVGLLAAHIERLRTGVGRLVSASLLEFALAGLSGVAGAYLASGEIPGLLGTHSPTFAPYGGFRTADGWLVIAGAGSEDMWTRCCHALGLDELVADERFRNNRARVKHRDELTRCLEGVLRQNRSSHWLSVLSSAGVPAAEVKSLPQVLAAEQVTALQSIQRMAHPVLGSYPAIGPPVRLDRAVVAYGGAAPELGADTRGIARSLGFDDEFIDHLVAEGLAVAP